MSTRGYLLFPRNFCPRTYEATVQAWLMGTGIKEAERLQILTDMSTEPGKALKIVKVFEGRGL